MHFLESFALVTALPISYCQIQEDIIDLPNTKYITFHPFCRKAPSRQYKHWQKVIDELLDNNSFDCQIIEIGEAGGEKYINTNQDYLNKLTINQLAYLIKNSPLHLGYDSFPVHLASHYQKKIVALYAGQANIAWPYFSDPKDIIILESEIPNVIQFVDGEFKERKGRASHSFYDEFDLINKVEPSEVANSVIKLLNN